MCYSNIRHMKKICLIFAVILTVAVASPTASAQFFSKDRIIYGGGFGFNITDDWLLLRLAPEIGYQLFSPWQISVGLNYQYSEYGIWGNTSYRSASHLLGYNVSTRLDFVRFGQTAPTKLFLYAAFIDEFDITHRHTYDRYSDFRAGIGIRQYFSSRSSLYLICAWTLWDNDDQWKWVQSDWNPHVSIGVQF